SGTTSHGDDALVRCLCRSARVRRTSRFKRSTSAVCDSFPKNRLDLGRSLEILLWLDCWSELLMTDVLSRPVLLLNRVFQPVQLTTAKRAFVLLYGGAAHALDDNGEEYDFDLWRELPVRDEDDSVPIVGGALRVPRVLHLHRYDRTPKVTVRLTRRNL